MATWISLLAAEESSQVIEMENSVETFFVTYRCLSSRHTCSTVTPWEPEYIYTHYRHHIRTKHFNMSALIEYMPLHHQTLTVSLSGLTCGMVSLLKVKVTLAQSLSGWQRACTAGRWADQHSPCDEQGFTKHCSSRNATHSWPSGQSPRPEPSIRQGLGPHHSWWRDEGSVSIVRYQWQCITINLQCNTINFCQQLNNSYNTHLSTGDNPLLTVTGVAVFGPLCPIYSNPTSSHTRTSGDWEKKQAILKIEWNLHFSFFN